jgi:hypothetical protein
MFLFFLWFTSKDRAEDRYSGFHLRATFFSVLIATS